MADNIKQQTISSVKWASIERFSIQAIQFIIGVVLARLLSPSDYGQIGMLYIFIAMSSVFIDGGFSSALIRKVERTERDYSTVFVTNFIISLIVFIILQIISPLVADFYEMPILCPVLRIQSISLLLYAIISVQTTKLQSDLNFKSLAKANIISSPLSGIIAIIFAYCGFGVWALVIQNLSSILIRLICILYICRWFPKVKFYKKEFDELFNFGKNILGSNLLYHLYVNLDSIIIGKFFKSSDLGNFTRGCQIANLPVNNINGVLNTVTFPILAKLQNDKEALISAYRKYIKLASLCIFFSCMLLAALGKPLVILLLTDKWFDAIIYLQIYCFAIMLDHLNVINMNLVRITGRGDLILRLEIIKRCISILILFSAIPFGVIGICISKVIYSVIAVYINTYYSGKLFNMGFMSQLKDYRKYFIISLFVCIPTFIITLMEFNDVLTLICGLLISISLYYLSLRHDDIMREICYTIKQKISLNKYRK